MTRYGSLACSQCYPSTPMCSWCQVKDQSGAMTATPVHDRSLLSPLFMQVLIVKNGFWVCVGARIESDDKNRGRFFYTVVEALLLHQTQSIIQNCAGLFTEMYHEPVILLIHVSCIKNTMQYLGCFLHYVDFFFKWKHKEIIYFFPFLGPNSIICVFLVGPHIVHLMYHTS